MENYLLSEIERRYSVVRCVRFVVGGAGWSACPAGGRKWKVNDAKTGNGILWIVGNRLPVPLLARARTSRAPCRTADGSTTRSADQSGGSILRRGPRGYALFFRFHYTCCFV